jgi:hypothetical protein
MKKETVDRMFGISAMIISFVTLIIFIYQTNIIHQQSRLSVRPRLNFQSAFNHNDSIITYILEIENKGIGPAIINEATIYYEGKKYPVEMESFFNEAYPGINKYGGFNRLSTLSEGSSLTANEVSILFSFSFHQEDMKKLEEYLQIKTEEELPFKLVVNYSSIYEEEWQIDSDNNGHPRRIK